MSLRINDVKKVLRDSGVEMDADDILAIMRARPPYRSLTRVQVAQSLSSLCESDPDIIRTRLGLYQHVSQPLASSALAPVGVAAPRRLTLTAPAPAALSEALTEEPSTSTSATGAVVVVEVPHLEDDLGRHAGHPVAVSDPEGAADYLLSVAKLRLRRRNVEVAWCTGPVAAAAEATRRQWADAHLVLIASPDVVTEARATANQLHRPLTVWTSAPSNDDQQGLKAGIQSLPLADLLHCCTPTTSVGDDLEPPPTPPVDEPQTPSASTVTANPLQRSPAPAIPPAAVQAAVRAANHIPTLDRPDRVHLDCLWFLSVALYESPVPGVTGFGNAHTLRRQAHQLGDTYARRWWQVATDADHDQLAVSGSKPSASGLDVPQRLYPDLLRFAEQHHLKLHSSAVLKDQLRRGFWSAVHALQEARVSPSASLQTS
jgi:hypothetical protein